jgi:hypothetical protein
MMMMMTCCPAMILQHRAWFVPQRGYHAAAGKTQPSVAWAVVEGRSCSFRHGDAFETDYIMRCQKDLKVCDEKRL